jgi:HEAT repeat protein
MKIKNILLAVLSLLLISSSSFAQDKRTLETKIADLLAQFPANDLQYTNKLMDDMYALGEEGLKKICDQIIPAGTGDDTRQRFAVETLSRYLSQKGKENEKAVWERICISYATEQKDPGVKDFFFKKLQLIGGEKSAEAMKAFLADKDNCNPAVAVLTSTGGKTAENILAESLKEKDLSCAAAVMNALAGMKSKAAVNEYITWASNENTDIKTAAYNALAQSADPLAYPVLLNAAKNYSYRWESTGATSALLNYAKNIAQNGDTKTMDKICKLLISNCNDKLTMQNKTAALETYVSFHGIKAFPQILKAAGHSDSRYRNAAINMSASIPGNEVAKKWITFFPKAIPEAKPEILRMLGARGDEQVLSLLTSSLNDKDIAVRIAAAEAVAKISGKKAAASLIGYLMNFDNASDQEAATSALKSISGNEEISLLKPVLKDGSHAAKKSAIALMAWNKNHEYFSEVIPYTSSTDESVKASAYKALGSLAGSENQEVLIDLLSKTDNPVYIADIQNALAVAANKTANPQKRSSVILKAMEDKTVKGKLIPVLARTGGREALSAVLKEFENGNPEMRETCFKTLSSWTDYSASSALYEICASGNKTYEAPSFEGYVQQIRNAPISDEEKLLLLRKIMPFAKSAEQKNEILNEAGKLKNYQSLFFVAEYIDNPTTSAVAARSAMNIALPSASSKAGMYGNMVRDILTRVVPKLTGSESEYDKEMVNKYLASMLPDEGFVPMFNGKDLSGWQGLVENPVTRAKMRPAELAKKQAEADKKVPANWSVKDGCIWFNGSGENLCSIKEYCDFEMLVDWKISKKGDSGIYLRGSPQVQIWDTSRVEVGAQVGSGGLYNNQKNPSKPLKVADNPIDDWNTFRIIMIGEKVSVWLNGELVADNVTLENYWDRNTPIFPKGPIELQAHGTDLAFRDIYVREISEKEYNLTPEEKAEGFVLLFNGHNLDGWVGDKVANVVKDGIIITRAELEHGGNIYTEKEYADFIFRFDFLLAPGSNNGVGIRAPLTGDAAYVGMELQIIDNTTSVFGKLEPYQMHGSVYGVIPAKTGYLKPVGEWNSEEIIAIGTKVKIILNGTVILDGDIAEASKNGTMDHREDHTGLKNKTGHIGFLYHTSVVKFKNIRIKDLSK